MLKLLSMTNTACSGLVPSYAWSLDAKKGRANANPTSSTAAVRSSSNSRSRRVKIRRFRCRASRRKSMAAQCTTRYRRRLSKWMISGPAAAISPAMAKEAATKDGTRFISGVAWEGIEAGQYIRFRNPSGSARVRGEQLGHGATSHAPVVTVSVRATPGVKIVTRQRKASIPPARLQLSRLGARVAAACRRRAGCAGCPRPDLFVLGNDAVPQRYCGLQ